jgi:predicted short-subunit dehydrogenase-like oxidoreductase (DUF2520 family)
VKTKPSITIVGPGSLGASLAVALDKASYPIPEIVYRSGKKRGAEIARATTAKAVHFDQADFAADIVWICVGDRDIAATAGKMQKSARWTGKIVFHASGALASDELAPLRSAGAAVASVHPMMSFVRGATTSFTDVSFALEGDSRAVRTAASIAHDLGGTSFPLKKGDKPLYHALGAFASPLLVAQLATAERIGRKLGLAPERTRQVIAPILRRTISNYLERGPAAAFSGPILRGDIQTISRHLAALRRVRGANEIYRALAKVAIEDLPANEPTSIKKLLRR